MYVTCHQLASHFLCHISVQLPDRVRLEITSVRDQT